MNRSKKTDQKVTAIYCRLSIEDGNNSESMSISNQKTLLLEYAEKNGFSDIEYYVDDGYTGRNSNRPAFQRLLSDVEAGKIGVVLSKDLSRLSRNYLEAGSYIEVFFPKYNVRYIAVTDGVDTLTRQQMDITPFKNILNDMYSRDISKKVLSSIMSRSGQGMFCGGMTPYGLKRDPDKKGHLIIDEQKAPVIRKIYGMALNGDGCMKIAKKLMEERIPITKISEENDHGLNRYSWSSSRISRILRNPFYKGAHVVCRTHQKGIRSHTYDVIPREEWEVIEDCHEAIISREDWERVQKLIDRRPPIMQGNECPFYNLFHGLVYCATCGRSMQVKYEKVGRTDTNRSTMEKREPIDKAYYICQTYNRLGKDVCTSHKIEARDLYDLVLKDIRALAKEAVEDEEAFFERIIGKMGKEYLDGFSELKKEMEGLQKRNSEIDEIIGNLYTDKVKGVLTEQRFVKLSDGLEDEQQDNNARISQIKDILRENDTNETDIRSFIDEIREYGTVRKLDEVILNRLINKILIGEKHVENGEKVQEVRIIYNFVGEIEVTEAETA